MATAPTSRRRAPSAASGLADVSAVMALYNGGELTREALDSIVTQTLPPREVVIVNDGSTDESLRIVTSYVAKYRGPISFVVTTKENGGQGSARNEGVARAQGAYIAFIDQDDSWPVNHIEVLITHFGDRPDLGWVYSDYCQIDDAGKTVRRGYLKGTHYEVPGSSIYSMIGQDLMMLPSASLIRTRAFRDAGGFDTQFRGYEDDDLFLRIFQAGWAFEFEARPVTNYRIHAENSSRQSSFLRSRERFYFKYRETFEAAGPEAFLEFRRGIAERMTRSFINDAVALNRVDIPGDFRQELIRVAKRVMGDLGWTLKRRVVMMAVRHTSLVPFMLRVNARFNRRARSHGTRVF